MHHGNGVVESLHIRCCRGVLKQGLIVCTHPPQARDYWDCCFSHWQQLVVSMNSMYSIRLNVACFMPSDIFTGTTASPQEPML